MKGAEKLFDAITGVEEGLIDEALDYRFRKKAAGWRRFGTLAAALALAASLSLFTLFTLGSIRGCGSKGGNGAPPASADTAPQDAAAGESGGAEFGSSTDSDTCAPTAPQTPEGEPVEGVSRFTAVVAEVHETYLLLTVEEGDGFSAGESASIPTGALENLPALVPGDRVSVTFSGTAPESEPLQPAQVLSVEKLNTFS